MAGTDIADIRGLWQQGRNGGSVPVMARISHAAETRPDLALAGLALAGVSAGVYVSCVAIRAYMGLGGDTSFVAVLWLLCVVLSGWFLIERDAGTRFAALPRNVAAARVIVAALAALGCLLGLTLAGPLHLAVFACTLAGAGALFNRI